MSDSPDRRRRFHGGASPGHPSCEYPAGRSDPTRVSDDHGATSDSAPSESCFDMFDFDAYYGSDALTDVTSDAPSEGRSAAARSAGLGLGPGTPATSLSSHEEDSPMPDAPSPSPESPLVWPEFSGTHLPRDPTLQLDASPSPPPSTYYPEMPNVGQPPAPSQKRTRKVNDPVETSQVREVKACYHCRMNKSKCDPSRVCTACLKKPLSDEVCIRKPLGEMIPPKHARWNWHDPSLFMPSREQFGKERFTLFISFSDRVESPCLPVTAGYFTLPNHSAPGWGIAPNDCPHEAAFYEWMEEQIRVESRTDFEAELDRLLLKFVRRPQTALLSGDKRMSVIETMLANLLKMRCMWKIWSSKHLFYRRQRGLMGTSFELQVSSIQDSLRMYAAQAISELERKVVSDIETHLVKKDTTRMPPTMRATFDVMRWLLLWQVILLYRQSLSLVMEQQQTNAAPLSLTVMPMNEKRHSFREATRQLLDAVTVIYSGLFHKKTVVESLRDAEARVFGDDCDLYAVYQRAWTALPNFYQQVLGQLLPTDRLFEEYIVKKETRILAKGRPSRK